MEPTRKSSFAVFVVTVGIVTFLASGVTALREVFWWLKHGYWKPILVTDAFRWIGLAEPNIEEWVGAQKLWNILRDSPLSLVCFGLGVIIVMIGRYFLNDQAASRPRRRLLP